MAKVIFFLVVTIILALLQLNFLQSFDILHHYLNIIIVSATILTVYGDYRRGFLFAFVSGLLMDIYSPYAFGVITLALIVPALVIYYLLKKLLANKSVYSLMLVTAASTVMYYLIIWLGTNLAHWFGSPHLVVIMTREYAAIITGQIVVHTVIIMLFFLALRFLGRRIRTNLSIPGHI